MTESPLSHIEQLTGWKTSDGKVFEDVEDARRAQALIDQDELFDKGNVSEEVRQWLSDNWLELEMLEWVRRTGQNPLYRERDW